MEVHEKAEVITGYQYYNWLDGFVEIIDFECYCIPGGLTSSSSTLRWVTRGTGKHEGLRRYAESYRASRRECDTAQHRSCSQMLAICKFMLGRRPYIDLLSIPRDRDGMVAIELPCMF